MAAAMLAPALLVLLLVLAAPVGYLISFSFLPADGGASGATLMNYHRLVTDPFYRGVLAKTLWIALLSTAIATVVGYCLAHFLWRAHKRWRGVLTILVLCPLLVSIVVSSYGWMVLLGKNGVINQLLMSLGILSEPLKLMHTDGGIVVGLVHIAIPFMTLSILAALERIDRLLPEAAATLGANSFRVLWHVLLPLALPGIAAGTMIVFCICMSAYVTPALLGGSGPTFITTLIYNQIVALMDWRFGATLAAFLLVVALVVVLLYVRLISWLSRSSGERLQAT